MHQRLALLGVTLAVSVPVGLGAAVPASAATYPSKAKSQFLKSCKKGAKGAGATSKQSKVYCEASLKCLQRTLSLSDFKEYGIAVSKGDKTPPHNRAVKKCIKEAQKKL